MEAVIEALGLETEAAGRSGADSKEGGSETGDREENSGTGNRKANERDCTENRGTDSERKQSEESRVENLVADFDLHVDRVFQAASLVVACTSDPLSEYTTHIPHALLSGVIVAIGVTIASHVAMIIKEITK